MRKKILTGLAPITVIILSMMAPAVAQANDQIQGTEYTITSNNLTFQFGSHELLCAISAFQFQTTASDEQSQVIGAAFRGAGGALHCNTWDPSIAITIQSNAGTAGWFFHTGEEEQGSLQGALENVALTVHFVFVKGQYLVDTCILTAEEGVELNYVSNVLNPNFSLHTTLMSECEMGGLGEVQLEGDFATTAGGLTIDS